MVESIYYYIIIIYISLSLSLTLRIHHNVTRFVQAAPHQKAAHGAVQIGHLHTISSSVCPVQLAAHPVHCHTRRHLCSAKRESVDQENVGV